VGLGQADPAAEVVVEYARVAVEDPRELLRTGRRTRDDLRVAASGHHLRLCHRLGQATHTRDCPVGRFRFAPARIRPDRSPARAATRPLPGAASRLAADPTVVVHFGRRRGAGIGAPPGAGDDPWHHQLQAVEVAGDLLRGTQMVRGDRVVLGDRGLVPDPCGLWYGGVDLRRGWAACGHRATPLLLMSGPLPRQCRRSAHNAPLARMYAVRHGTGSGGGTRCAGRATCGSPPGRRSQASWV